jgi:hypothetical protein
MQRARAFFYVCAGIFLLALSYYLGASNATAQANSSVTGFTTTDGCTFYVLTPNGDIFKGGRVTDCNSPFGAATRVANFWNGATPAAQQTWGKLKASYRK